MKLINMLATSLTIALGVLAQSNSTTPENQTIDTLNLTESEALARSLTWYHLDEDDEQELCGNTDAKPDGREDILKEDCQELIDFMKTRPGYWKVNGYNYDFGLADLVTRGTCEFTVTREDALNTYFEIGNMDVISMVEAAMRTTRDPTRMATVSGTVTCAGDFTPLIGWQVDYPLSGALTSVRMSAMGWLMVGVSMFAFTFM